MRTDADGVIIDEELIEAQLVRVGPSAVEARRGYDMTPVIPVQSLIQRRQVVAEVIEGVWEEGVDYGPIPGTEGLHMYQEGADALCQVFGLATAFKVDQEDIDHLGERHGGEAYIGYTVTCHLSHEGVTVASGSGNCNSWEKKYRYTSKKRCPECGNDTIFRSKKGDGGWYCWSAKGGCGAQFASDDPRLGTQAQGREPNPDVFDLQNTILKMAMKRAYMSAVSRATGVTSVLKKLEMRGRNGGTQQVQRPAANGHGAASITDPQPCVVCEKPVPAARATICKGKGIAICHPQCEAKLVAPAAPPDELRSEQLFADGMEAGE